MADISQQIKDLLANQSMTEQESWGSRSYYDTARYGAKRTEAANLLKSTYGYDDTTANWIVSVFTPVTSPAGESVTRDQYRSWNSNTPYKGVGFGSTYDVDKYFGGISGLANYLASGGGITQGVSAPADYNAYRGGTPILMKSTGETAYKEGQISPSEATQNILQQTGKEPTPEGIASLVGQPLGTQITPESLASYAGTQPTAQQSLVDIYTSRPDLQTEANKLFPGVNPTIGGSAANTWLNDWWNTYGTKEYAGTQLTQPSAPKTELANMVGGGGTIGGGTTGGGTLGTQTGGGTPVDTYKDFLSSWLEGYGKKQQATTNLQNEISKIEQELADLEKNINARIGEASATGGVVTSAQAARYQALESKEPRQQLAELTRNLSGMEQGLAGERSLLPYYKELAEYQTPAEQYAQTLKEYEDKLKLEQQYATPEKPTTTADITEYNFAKSQGYTGTFEQWTAKKTTPTTPTPDLNTNLFNVGIPLTTVSTKGKITDSMLTKLGQGGIPPTDAQTIMDYILTPHTLEETRQWLKSQGVDPKVLDTFMQTLQGLIGGGEEGITNPFK